MVKHVQIFDWHCVCVNNYFASAVYWFCSLALLWMTMYFFYFSLFFFQCSMFSRCSAVPGSSETQFHFMSVNNKMAWLDFTLHIVSVQNLLSDTTLQGAKDRGYQTTCKTRVTGRLALRFHITHSTPTTTRTVATQHHAVCYQQSWDRCELEELRKTPVKRIVTGHPDGLWQLIWEKLQTGSDCHFRRKQISTVDWICMFSS